MNIKFPKPLTLAVPLLLIIVLIPVIVLAKKNTKEPFSTALNNPNLVLNTQGPTWGQQTVAASLVPNAVALGAYYTIGTINPIVIQPTNAGNFSPGATYSLGNLVSFIPAGSTTPQVYLNLGWNADTRGCPAYCGTYNQTPGSDTFAWKPVMLLDNPNLVLNPVGPTWGQQTINQVLINRTTSYGQKYSVGTAPQITIQTSDAGPWAGNVTYSTPGQIVSYNNMYYMNIAWNQDKRGPAYSGNYRQNPTTDTYAWIQVNLKAPAPGGAFQAPAPGGAFQAPAPGGVLQRMGTGGA